MAVTSTRVGAPIVISIGRRGLRPDLYPARIVGPAQMVVSNGRTQEMAKVIVHQQNLAGESYLAERVQNLAFAFDRSERDEMLDGSPASPKTWQDLVKERAAATLQFLASLPESGQEISADELSAELPI